jgi:hypothetical protein
MSHHDVFVLADEQGEGYHDYLNFGGGGGGQNEAASSMPYSDDEYSKPTPVRKGKGRKPTAVPRAKKEATEAELFGPLYTMRQQLNEKYARPMQSPSGEEEGEATDGKRVKIPAKQVAEHQTVMMNLQRYTISRFAPRLKEAGLKLTNLESKSLAELKSLQTRARTVCSSGCGSTGMLYSGILTGASVVEKMAPKRFMNLDGFSAALRADPEFEDLAELIDLDMGFASSMSPLQRMALCMGKNALTVNAMNRQKNQLLENLIAQQQMQAHQHPQHHGVPFTAPPAASIVQPSAASVSEVNNPSQPIRTGAIPQYDD